MSFSKKIKEFISIFNIKDSYIIRKSFLNAMNKLMKYRKDSFMVSLNNKIYTRGSESFKKYSRNCLLHFMMEGEYDRLLTFLIVHGPDLLNDINSINSGKKTETSLIKKIIDENNGYNNLIIELTHCYNHLICLSKASGLDAEFSSITIHDLLDWNNKNIFKDHKTASVLNLRIMTKINSGNEEFIEIYNLIHGILTLFASQLLALKITCLKLCNDELNYLCESIVSDETIMFR